MSSLTASASMPKPPMQILAVERMGRNFDPVKHAADAQREAKRRAQHEVDMLAIEYAKIMMQKSINEALDDKTDPRLRRDLRNDIMNRGIGRVPEAETPNRAKKPEELAAGNILEMLAAISASAGAAAIEASRKPPVLGHTRGEPIERDITPEPVAVVEHQAAPLSDEDLSFEELMADITGEKPRGMCDL